MRTITINIYKFDELSEEAKETAISEFLETDLRTDDFHDAIMEDLKNLFPNSHLRVQFSLSSCQGDGVNIFGTAEISDLRSCVEQGLIGNLSDDVKGIMSREDWDAIAEYSDKLGVTTVPIPMNSTRYCYSVADRVDFADSWVGDLEDMGIVLDKEKTSRIFRFQKFVSKLFGFLDSSNEKAGYEYLYSIDKEEYSEMSDVNGWEYYEDGSLY